MRLLLLKNTVFITLMLLAGCNKTAQKNKAAGNEGVSAFAKADTPQNNPIIVGANRIEAYLPLLKNKTVGIVTNQSGLVFKSYPHTAAQSTHLVDTLQSLGVRIKTIFSPEHGFRGKADAGEHVADGKDLKTGLPIASLHGKNKKPSPEQLESIDVMLFDIQDVGVRFYTYISTMTYVMDACAAQHIPVIILDRPNPNGHYVDGPVLEKVHSSFLGLHEVPLVYGMTIGEYAQMVNGEGWLESGKAALTVIPLQHWDHQTPYALPVRPSPNLPNDQSINLYPSLGLFEGTSINAGRGTEMQFQVFGAGALDPRYFDFSYTPQPNFGSKYPKEEGLLCYGRDLRNEPRLNHVNLKWLVEAYEGHTDKANFFNTQNFTLHAGNTELQRQIEQGYTATELRKSWRPKVEAFEQIRAKYLMYK